LCFGNRNFARSTLSTYASTAAHTNQKKNKKKKHGPMKMYSFAIIICLPINPMAINLTCYHLLPMFVSLFDHF
jgi:hypothetical protein